MGAGEVSNQIAISGDDWHTPNEAKRLKKAIAAKDQTRAKLVKALDASVEAMNSYCRACDDLADGSEVLRADDSRLRLIQMMSEYARWLDQ